MSARTDDPNHGGPRKQAWGKGQGFVTGNGTETHMLRPTKNIVNRPVR